MRPSSSSHMWPSHGKSAVELHRYDVERTVFRASGENSHEDVHAASWLSQRRLMNSLHAVVARIVRFCVFACTPRKLPKLIIMIMGCYQLVLLLLSILDALSPDSAISSLASIVFNGALRGDTLSVPEATSPISCHSHNDYWRIRPLYSALDIGCSSVEADIWLEDDDLLVGHTRASLSRQRTLSSTYLDPILEILDRRNHESNYNSIKGVFESDPLRSLILLVDLKVDGQAIWPVLNQQLEPLRNRNYLTFFNGSDIIEGPVTLVVSGDAWFSDVVRNSTHRDIFLDAPLQIMHGNMAAMSVPGVESNDIATDVPLDDSFPIRQPIDASSYSPANSYYASASFMRTIGYPVGSRLSTSQLDLLRAQINGAHQRGLKVRYWNVPPWPLGVRNYLWRVLVREGVDYLSVDDIKAVAREDWGPRKGGWNRKWWM